METDLGIKKKKKSKKPKEGDDDFAAKLAALDLEKEGGEATEEKPVQEGDMYVIPPLLTALAVLNCITWHAADETCLCSRPGGMLTTDLV